MAGRIDPLPPKQWAPEMREALEPLRPPVPRDPGRPKGLNVLGLLAWHPTLTKAFNTFNGHVLYSSTLTGRQRELLILRVASRRKCEYEWRQHVVTAPDVDITTEEVERVAAGPSAPGWSPVEAALLAAADELVDDARIGDSTWAVLSEEFDERQILDIVFTVGSYELLAMMMRTCDLELDDDLR